MKTGWLPGIVLAVGVLLITVHFWSTLLSKKEGFLNQEILKQVLQNTADEQKETPISETQAAQHYRSLLVFISHDFTNGLKLVHDLNKRVYGQAFKIPEEFDPRRITDNYKNPIAGI